MPGRGQGGNAANALKSEKSAVAQQGAPGQGLNLGERWFKPSTSLRSKLLQAPTPLDADDKGEAWPMWPLFIFFYISIFSNSIWPLDLDRWLWQGPAADGNLSPSSARRWWRRPASACSPRPRRARRRGRTSSRSKGSSSRSLAAALYRSSTLPARRKKANRLRDPLEFCKIEYICFCSGEMSIRNICLSQYHVSKLNISGKGFQVQR